MNLGKRSRERCESSSRATCTLSFQLSRSPSKAQKFLSRIRGRYGKGSGSCLSVNASLAPLAGSVRLSKNCDAKAQLLCGRHQNTSPSSSFRSKNVLRSGSRSTYLHRQAPMATADHSLGGHSVSWQEAAKISHSLQPPTATPRGYNCFWTRTWHQTRS